VELVKNLSKLHVCLSYPHTCVASGMNTPTSGLSLMLKHLASPGCSRSLTVSLYTCTKLNISDTLSFWPLYRSATEKSARTVRGIIPAWFGGAVCFFVTLFLCVLVVEPGGGGGGRFGGRRVILCCELGT